MESTNSTDSLLWFMVGFFACSMAAVLVVGWLKGHYWQRELKKRQR